MLSGYNGSPDSRFFRGTTRLISWSDVKHSSCPLQSLVVSLLLSLVSTLVFSRTGGVLSHRNSLTHKFLRFPPRNLCSSSRSLCVFSSSLQRTQLTVKLSPGLAESRIFYAAPADTSHLIPHCPDTDSAPLIL